MIQRGLRLASSSSSPSSPSSPSDPFDINANPLARHPRVLRTKKHGIDVLHDPLWNKGTAFTLQERDRLGLRGLLPPVFKTIEQQMERVFAHLGSLPNDIEKNRYLQDLQSRNETLFHRVLSDHIDTIAPLVYTPTVGAVCEQFGTAFTRSRGMYLSAADRGSFAELVYNWPHDDVHVIVVTDGSRILGLGDLGVHGMGIPIGKLALYCAAGGIAPHRVLPVVLDVGTNNPKLLEDPQYIGTRAPRLTGAEYVEMVDEFMQAVFHRWPEVVVQFEDFESTKAAPLLQRYRHKYRMFNDDIQGTGSVTLSALLSAARNAGSSIADMRVLCAGAGSAGLGVCAQIVDGMVAAGLPREEAQARFVILTSQGALGRRDGKHGDPNFKRPLASDRVPWITGSVSDGASLLEAVREFRPTVLLGLAAQAGVFTEDAVREMAGYCAAPIVMPMSNPTSKAECSAAQAYAWTDGRAIVATGSPFPAYDAPDGRRLIPSQCNNMYVFPGIGLAASVAGVKHITDRMLYEASVACTATMTPEEIAEGRTFPVLRRIREVSKNVATAVIKEARRNNLCTKDPFNTPDISDELICHIVERKMYYPFYVPLVE